MNLTAYQEKKNNEETKTSMKEAEDKRPILEKLFAALLRSLRGQHGKNVSKEVPGRTGTLGKANSRFDQTQTGLGTATPR